MVLTVTDHLGESDTGTVSVEILADPSANQSPESVISAGALSGAAPLEITFNGTGSGDADGMITGYEWDFGDGTDNAGEKVTHIFYDPGVYLVTLVVVDDAGALAQQSGAGFCLVR